jgi:hypothetical protein
MGTWEMTRSGRNVVWSASIPGSDIEPLQLEFMELWRHFASSLKDAGRMRFVRVEIWADSGRVVCFGVNESDHRVANITYQILVEELKNQWDELSARDLSDKAFQKDARKLMGKYVQAIQDAAYKSEPPAPIRYFDADADTPLTPGAEGG